MASSVNSAAEAEASADASGEMPDHTVSNLTDNLKTVYDQLCGSYRAIDDIRMKLLGLLPIATGAGILVLTGGGKSASVKGLASPIGLFGVVVTIGLFSYELHGIKKCGYLIDAGRLIEERLGIYGQFQRRPHEFLGFIDEPLAASIIYPAVLAGWLFLALLKLSRWVDYLSASVIFLAGAAGSIYFIRAMEEDMNSRVQYHKEKVFLRIHKPDRDIRLPSDARIK